MSERFQVGKVNGGAMVMDTTTSNYDENVEAGQQAATMPTTTTMPSHNGSQVNANAYANTNANANANVNVNANGYAPRKASHIFNNLANILRRASRQEGPERKDSLTKEALPRLDNYRQSKRNLKRPSIGELQGEPAYDQAIQIPEPAAESSSSTIKLGWIVGVMVPCLLNIWGVMLFLRLSWVVGQSGVFQSLMIITISSVVCIITTLSLSAISTNGEVKGGGVYFIISRSLGPEFGASVGVVFAFANAVAAAMNTIGFCDSLNDLLKNNDLKIVDNGINDVRIIGTITLIVLILICCVGMEWESKAQNFLIVTIVLAIFNFLIGAGIGPMGDEERIAKGFVGFSAENMKENWGPDYRYSEGLDQTFFSVFAIYFPSVTGIQAGANICGDLRDAAMSIPKGTLWAVFISMLSYASFAVFAGGAAARDASGNVSDLVNGTIVPSMLPCKENFTCEYGLHNSYTVMQLMSLWGPLIYAGCFAATLSTALTNLLSVPRLVQALGIDQIYPGLIFFSKPYGKHGEPYRGYVLTFFISAAFLLIGELNVIAPLISTFYLASYAMINFCTFHAAFVKPLGWRPTFKYYNVWLSLSGCLLCVAIMFLIDWMSSLITFFIVFALYLVVMYRKPDANWGSSTQAQQFRAALTAVHRLQNVSDHVKNYHPKVLVLTGEPSVRPPLIDFANLLTKNNSLLFVGNVIPNRIGYKNRRTLITEGQEYLDARKIKAFYNVIDGLTLEDGVLALIQATGFGKMTPNIILLGYKSDWCNCPRNDVETYFNVLHSAFAQRMSVAIVRLPNGVDFTKLNPEITMKTRHRLSHMHTANAQGIANPMMPPANAASDLLHVDSNLNLAAYDDISPHHSFTQPQPPPMPNMSGNRNTYRVTGGDDIIYSTKGGSVVPKNVLDALTVFTRKQPKSTIDVFWLYDDGGLTMLLPYIISMRSNWNQCKLRVFALTQGKDDEMEEKNLENLLNKFRIKYSELIMLKGLNEPPSPQTVNKHKLFCQHSMQNFVIQENELHALEEKTNRQLRIHEYVVKYSSQAALIVMSLPMPRKEAVSAGLYMSWLEMLTSEIKCPMVLARGNQTPVLTLYS